MESNRKVLRSAITYKHGNLLDSSAQCLINPVNTVGVMGAGLALAFKKLYPDMFRSYKRQCDKGIFTTGRLLFYRPQNTNEKIICMFPTKEHWQSLSQLEYIESGLMAFCQYYSEWNITSVAFPKLGCGLGGLNWDYHVKPLMELYLNNLPISIEIYI